MYFCMGAVDTTLESPKHFNITELRRCFVNCAAFQRVVFKSVKILALSGRPIIGTTHWKWFQQMP